MAKAARRQHYIARFYLRNFAEPMFSDNLCVYDREKRRWEKRSPNGVGWFPHLCSMIGMDGTRTDSFDRFLKKQVEDPSALPLKKLASGAPVDADERSAVAFFVAITAARSPEVMKASVTEHLSSLAPSDRADLDDLVKRWCYWTGKPYGSKSQSEFLKPGQFGAIWMWANDLRRRLLQWEWRLIATTRERPFVTSDRPVFGEWDRKQDMGLVSFPVSSEAAIIIVARGQFNEDRDRSNQVCAMNRQTVDRATQFVVACKKTFPGSGSLL